MCQLLTVTYSTYNICKSCNFLHITSWNRFFNLWLHFYESSLSVTFLVPWSFCNILFQMSICRKMLVNWMKSSCQLHVINDHKVKLHAASKICKRHTSDLLNLACLKQFDNSFLHLSARWVQILVNNTQHKHNGPFHSHFTGLSELASWSYTGLKFSQFPKLLWCQMMYS